MVATTAPTAVQVENAAEEVERLGLTEALDRRYARFGEIPENAFLWRPEAMEQGQKKGLGIFAGIQTRENQAKKVIHAEDLPAATMTFVKFRRTFLDDAAKLEVLTDNAGRFMALVAPANESADNILRWGGDTASSRMSWYYRGGGIDGEMKRRVEAAGGRYEECEIRCSLRWDNEEPNRMSGTDLDLHCQTPYGEHIYYGAKRDRTGGYLDVDANANGRRTSETPVENIRWAEGMAKNGHYHFYVHNYKQMDRRFNAYTVELQVGDKTWTFDAEAMGTGYRMIAFDFDYWDGAVRNLMIRGRTESEAARVAATSGGMVWNVAKNQFVTVKGIVTSPNMWGENPMPQIGEHAFFLMEDCRDDGEHKHAGFIPETLIPALTEHRRTLQAYTSMVEIDGGEDADACGMGFGTFGDWNLILRVTMKDGARRIVKIDRFD